MSDWLPLRDHLAALVDQRIAAEPDREARATLTYHRERIVDQLELVMMRKIIAGRDAEQEAEPTSIIKLNGRKHRAVQ